MLQVAIIVIIFVVAAISFATGCIKGIPVLISFIVDLSWLLFVAFLLILSVLFIFSSYIESFETYVQNLFTFSTYHGDETWLSSWSIFFFAWFIGYGPMMVIFVARISRGRTIRQLVTAVSVIAPVIATFWFTVVGG